MLGRSLLVTLLLLCVGLVASAGSITYTATVDTSTISDTAGSLDFNFNPGPLVTQAASLQIRNFTSDGALPGVPTLSGDVTGALPATVTLDNGTGFNDYFEGFNFGKTISFDVSLYGPALSTPDGVSTSGSTFAFSMFSDAAGTIPAMTSNAANGFAFTLDVNLDGTTSVTDFSPETSVGPASAVPEPSALLPMVLIGFGLVLRRRQHTRNSRCV